MKIIHSIFILSISLTFVGCENIDIATELENEYAVEDLIDEAPARPARAPQGIAYSYGFSPGTNTSYNTGTTSSSSGHGSCELELSHTAASLGGTNYHYTITFTPTLDTFNGMDQCSFTGTSNGSSYPFDYSDPTNPTIVGP